MFPPLHPASAARACRERSSDQVLRDPGGLSVADPKEEQVVVVVDGASQQCSIRREFGNGPVVFRCRRVDGDGELSFEEPRQQLEGGLMSLPVHCAGQDGPARHVRCQHVLLQFASAQRIQEITDDLVMRTRHQSSPLCAVPVAQRIFAHSWFGGGRHGFPQSGARSVSWRNKQVLGSFACSPKVTVRGDGWPAQNRFESGSLGAVSEREWSHRLFERPMDARS